MILHHDRATKIVWSGVAIAGAAVLGFLHPSSHSFAHSLAASLLPQLSVMVGAFGVAGVLLALLQEVADRVEEHASKILPPAMQEHAEAAQ